MAAFRGAVGKPPRRFQRLWGLPLSADPAGVSRLPLQSTVLRYQHKTLTEPTLKVVFGSIPYRNLAHLHLKELTFKKIVPAKKDTNTCRLNGHLYSCLPKLSLFFLIFPQNLIDSHDDALVGKKRSGECRNSASCPVFVWHKSSCRLDIDMHISDFS